jgi:hypothetical protein
MDLNQLDELKNKQESAINAAVVHRNDYSISVPDARIICFSEPPRQVGNNLMFISNAHEQHWNKIADSSESDLIDYYCRQINNPRLLSELLD